MLLLTISVIVSACAAIYILLIRNFNHWTKRGVSGPKPQLIVGNYPHIFNQKKHMAHDIDVVYRAYKGTDDFVGIFNCRTPQLLILKPELMRRVLVNDFKHFHDNEFSRNVDSNTDPIFGQNPFLLTGQKWKDSRAEIVPGIAPSRIKTVYPITKQVCNKLTNFVMEESKLTGGHGLDTKDLCLRFTSEVVTDAVLGLQANSFSDQPTPILKMIKKLFDQSFILLFSIFITSFLPEMLHLYKPRFVPKSVENFFTDLVQTAINIRKKEKDRDRVDYLNYILELQEKKNLSLIRVTSHTMTFLLDGYETTANTIAHCLLLIARYPRTQEKLRHEIEQYLDSNMDIDFDILNDMPYLDACIHETLRLFPPGFVMSKLCTEPIDLISSKTGRTVSLKKGDVVTLPVWSVMHDEEFYPDVEEFKPERFLEGENSVKKYREMGLYYGFSDGPRVCLGMRFALTQSKAAMVAIVRKFNIHVNPRTRTDNEIDPKHFLTRLLGGIWLDFEERV